MPPTRTVKPYVWPRLIATVDALDFELPDPADDVVAALPEPAPPKVPSELDPDVAAAVAPAEPEAVDDVAFTRVGFWAPQGCAVLLYPESQPIVHYELVYQLHGVPENNLLTGRCLSTRCWPVLERG
jgi:hypothetical protein